MRAEQVLVTPARPFTTTRTVQEFKLWLPLRTLFS
jgi:hypothetical protein